MPPVIKWVVVWDFFTTHWVVYCRDLITRWGGNSGYKRVLLPYSRHLGSRGCDNNGCNSSGCNVFAAIPQAGRKKCDIMGLNRTRLASSLPRLRNARLVFAPWLGVDQERCCESPNIRRHGGTYACGLCTTVFFKCDRAWSHSSFRSRKLGLPIAMGHARTEALCLPHLHAGGLHTLCCGTLANLV